MNKLILGLIPCIAAFLFPTAYSSAMEAAQNDLKSQFVAANAEMVKHFTEMEEGLESLSATYQGKEVLYCDKTGVDCAGKDEQTVKNEKALIIKRVRIGWQGASEEIDYGDVASVSPHTGGHVDRADIFTNLLCAEYLFKTSAEVDHAKPMYTGKTVVFCARNSDNIRISKLDVDADTSNGGNSASVKVGSGKAGWECFNTSKDLGNTGAGALGYDSDGTKVAMTLGDGSDIFYINNCLEGIPPETLDDI